MGFKKNFIKNHTVNVPRLSQKQLDEYIKEDIDSKHYYLDYINYSLLQNPFRRFPYFTATNIDGALFKKVDREDNWEEDTRIPSNHQLGKSLYDANLSDFDKGHMTKREDVQWGESKAAAKEAANSTFYYTNAVPQMAKLNRSIWRRIENYILHSEGVKNKLKLSVFTGPVLNNNDPIFVTLIKGEKIKIPRLFWKVVYYLNQKNELSRAAFLTNQSYLLHREKIVIPMIELMRSPEGSDDFFLDFKDADTYQTDVAVIESLTSLNFCKAKNVYSDERIVRLILNEVDIRSNHVFKQGTNPTIKNLKL